MPLSIDDCPSDKGLKELLVEFEENAVGTDDTKQSSPTKLLTEFLDRTGAKPNEYDECDLFLDSCSNFTENFSDLKTLVDHIPTRLPNLEHMTFWLPWQIPVPRLLHQDVTSWLRTSAFAFVNDSCYDQDLCICVLQNNVFISAYGKGEDERTLQFIFNAENPPPIGTRGTVTEDLKELVLLEALRFHGDKITTVTMSGSGTTCSTENFQTICSLTQMRHLRFFDITMTSSEVATLARALYSTKKRKRRSNQEAGTLKNLARLQFKNATLETYHDFVFMCQAIGRNNTLVTVVVDGLLTILDSQESTFGPILDILRYNPGIASLQCTGNSSLITNENFDTRTTQAQQQEQLYALLKYSDVQLEHFVFGEWTHFPTRIQDRLDLQYYALSFMLEDRFDPCTLDPRRIGHVLALATEEHEREPDGRRERVEKPCLLSCVFTLFQAEPNLVHLIPPQALD